MFKPAICTQCGAQIQVDPNKEAAVCPSCGTAFITEKAINKYEIQNATINVVVNKEKTSLDQAEDVFNRGLSHYKLKEYSEASKNFDSAIKLAPENVKYRIYFLASQTKGFKKFDFQNISTYKFFSLATDKEKEEFSKTFDVDLSSEDDFLAYVLKNAKIECELFYFLSSNTDIIGEKSAKVLIELIENGKVRLYGSDNRFCESLYNKIIKYVSEDKKANIEYTYYILRNLSPNGQLYIRDENPFEKDGVLRVDDERVSCLNFEHYTKNKIYNQSAYAPGKAKTIFDKKGIDKLVITKNIVNIYSYSCFFDVVEVIDAITFTKPSIYDAIIMSAKMVILPEGQFPIKGKMLNNGRPSTVICLKGAPIDLPIPGYSLTFGYVSQGKVVYPRHQNDSFVKKFNEHLREFFGEEIKNGTLSGYIPDEKLGQKQGCYVATCVYGSYNCPEVWTLRRFRDYKLSKSAFGRAFIKTYYKISPKIVKVFGKTKWFNKLFKSILNRKVKRLKKKGYQDTPYNDLY